MEVEASGESVRVSSDAVEFTGESPLGGGGESAAASDASEAVGSAGASSISSEVTANNRTIVTGQKCSLP